MTLSATLAGPLFSASAWPDDARAFGTVVGTRIGKGDDIDVAAVYAHQRAELIERHIVAPFLPQSIFAQWEAALSCWNGADDTVYAVSFGVILGHAWLNYRLHLSVGLSPTLLSDHTVDRQNLGGPIQFTSHIGLDWRIIRRATLGLWAQHTSNAGIYDSNPGVDIVSVTLDYEF